MTKSNSFKQKGLVRAAIIAGMVAAVASALPCAVVADEAAGTPSEAPASSSLGEETPTLVRQGPSAVYDGYSDNPIRQPIADRYGETPELLRNIQFAVGSRDLTLQYRGFRGASMNDDIRYLDFWKQSVLKKRNTWVAVVGVVVPLDLGLGALSIWGLLVAKQRYIDRHRAEGDAEFHEGNGYNVGIGIVSVFFGAIAVAVTAVSAKMIAKREKQKRRLDALDPIH